MQELLNETQVSPFDIWDDVVKKIQDDPRFQLVPTPKERKATFDRYCEALHAAAATPSDDSSATAVNKDQVRTRHTS